MRIRKHARRSSSTRNQQTKQTRDRGDGGIEETEVKLRQSAMKCDNLTKVWRVGELANFKVKLDVLAEALRQANLDGFGVHVNDVRGVGTEKPQEKGGVREEAKQASDKRLTSIELDKTSRNQPRSVEGEGKGKNNERSRLFKKERKGTNRS
jgi:hypothetical protein